jgi:hypothetical protein
MIPAPGWTSDGFSLYYWGKTVEFVEFWGKSRFNSQILLLESWRTLHSSGHLLIRSTYRKTSNSDKVDSSS